MALHPSHLPQGALTFLTQRHLATLTTLRANGSPHVVPVGFTWDAEAHLVRVITTDGSVKVKNARLGGRAAVCQVDGRHWLTLEGRVGLLADPVSVREAEARYAARYRTPRINPRRIVLTIDVDRVLGHPPL